MIEPYDPQVLWIVIVGFIVAFILAFGIGANDVANSFGTSVGSKVLTLKQACVLATIFEVAGAVLLGYKVSDTIRKGIMDISIYNGTEEELMLGNLAALGGSSIWLILATFLNMPISGTHSIVGATLGYTLVARGTEGIYWKTLAKIVLSWFVSPVLSGVISMSIFVFIRFFILQRDSQLEPGLRALPIFYSLAIFVNTFSIVHDGPTLLYLDNIPWWGALAIASVVAVVVAVVVQFLIVPWQRRKILEHVAEIQRAQEVDAPKVVFMFTDSAGTSANPSPLNSRAISLEELNEEKKKNYMNERCLDIPPVLNGATLNWAKDDKEIVRQQNARNDGSLVSGPACGTLPPALPSATSLAMGMKYNSSQVPLVDPERSKDMVIPLGTSLRTPVDSSMDRPETAKLFSFLQVLTATFGSFAHGGNDVSNAIGPLVALYLLYCDGHVQSKSETPILILLYGGLGISVGLWILGSRVIKTLGEGLTKLTPSTGFTIEIGAAFTVLFASKIGIPISTTHCKVGSVVSVGWLRSKQGVDWKLFRNIALTWIVTVPAACGLSAAIMAILRCAVLK